ncbi:MAG: PIG-L family deacetylase [Pseudomonadota bacterium]|nr:PIG-L family deacetylase [Pseudomonadota bacterium]
MPALQLNQHDRVLVVAPHPDDESLGAGGLLQRAHRIGAAVRIVFATDGDNNPWPQRAAEKRWRIDETGRERWGGKRRLEAIAALKALSVPYNCARFLGYADQGLTAELTEGGKLFADLMTETETFRPTMVIAPSLSDRHPDHNSLALLLTFMRRRIDANVRWFSYLLHGKAPVTSAADLFALELNDYEVETKRCAVLCHESQMILCRKRFLRMVGKRELFYQESPAGTQHSAFRICGKLLCIDTPFLNFARARAIVLTRPEHAQVVKLCSRPGQSLDIRRLADGANDPHPPALPPEIWIKLNSPCWFADLTGWCRVEPASQPFPSESCRGGEVVITAFDKHASMS